MSKSASAENVMVTFEATPKQTIECVRSTPDDLSLYIWGPPGISKSSIIKQMATKLGVAFIDMRLSQMEPTDLRGIPVPVELHGHQTVAWIAPNVLPKNLDIEGFHNVEAVPTLIYFNNPVSDNDIHHCTQVNITARSVDPTLVAEVSDQKLDRFRVCLRNSSGQMVAGRVQFAVTGECQAYWSLEEFNSAPETVQAASYQLVLDRRLGEYRVPEKVRIFALSNRETDNAITYKLGTAISNRFLHVTMRADAEEWVEWAITANVHPDVIGFISSHTGHLMDFQPSSATRGFPTPRSWEFVSKIMHKVAREPVSEVILKTLITGAVGASAAGAFMLYRKSVEKLPPLESILNGTIKSLREELEPQLSYAFIFSACHQLYEEDQRVMNLFGGGTEGRNKAKGSPEKDKWLARFDNFLRFSMSQLTKEFAVVALRTSLKTYDMSVEWSKLNSLKEFVKEYGPMIRSMQ